jgi:IMP dehydrogenase/GMP reductase
MVGYILSDAKETPGPVFGNDDKTAVKLYFGSASFMSKLSSGRETSYIEGTMKQIPYTGREAKEIIEDISDGLQSAFSYTGSVNIEQFHKNAEFGYC